MTKEIAAVASDHAGVDMKTIIKERLINLNFEVLDLGTNTAASVDYPEFAEAVAIA